MKRLALLGLLAAGATLLAGCPIFDDSQTGPGCYDNCGTGGSPTTAPPGTCGAQKDCTGINETCGADGFCHTGDCTLWGCVGGQACVVVDQKASCGDAPSHGGSGGASMGGASMGGAVSAGGTGGATATGGAGGATVTGGAGGATATGGMGGAGGIGVSGGAGGVGGM